MPYTMCIMGFPGSFAGKESASNAGDPSSMSRSGISPREGLGCPLQDSWASPLDQSTIHLEWGRPEFNPCVGRSHGGNPLQYSCLENPQGQRSLAGCRPWDHKEWDKTEWLSTALYIIRYIFMIA